MNELKFLFQELAFLYKAPRFSQISLAEIDFERALLLAKKNNLLFLFCQEIKKSKHFKQLEPSQQQQVEKIVKSGLEMGEKTGFTIRKTKSILKKDLIFIKTYRNYLRLPNDLDVFVKDFKASFDKLDQNKIAHRDFDRKLKEVVFQNKDMVKVHLHGKIMWLNRKYFDNSIIWEQPRTVKFWGEEILIPGFTADFLMHLAHMNFEPMHFTMSELLYLFSISDKIDLEQVVQQSKKHHWHLTLVATLNIFNDFHHYLYGEPGPFKLANKVSKPGSFSDSDLILPKSFPRLHIIRAFLGKGVIWEPITKITKVVKVLWSGDSHGGFYEAPENSICKTKK